MAYPPAPWHLKGTAMQVLRLVPIERARAFVPERFKIVPILPGRTLGGVYLADYRPGSVLTYHELLIVPAIVRYRRKIGFWISHIYVDDADSMAGGREVWGLPKELADFTWQDDHITVQQAGQTLCTLHHTPPRSLWRQRLAMPNLSQLKGDVLFAKARIAGKLAVGGCQVDVPRLSPLGELGLAGPGRVFHFNNLEFIADVPNPQ